MRQRFITVLLCATALYLMCGCIRDYDFEREVTPRVVVNSILCPDSVIKVDLWWSKKLDGSEDFNRVTGAEVAIYENNAPLFNATSADETLTWDYKPKEGSTYSITVNYSAQKELRATTIVPHRPQVSCSFVRDAKGASWGSFRHYTLTQATVDEHTVALLMIYNQLYDTTGLMHSSWYESVYDGNNFSTNSILADPFNRYYEVENATAKGSAYDYRSMMRIPSDNLGNDLALSFAVKDIRVTYVEDEDWWFYPEIYPDDYKGEATYQTQYITFIAASADYDLYRKTLLQHRSADYESNAFMSQHVYRVHTNIENGLGIFAAHSDQILSFTKTE